MGRKAIFLDKDRTLIPGTPSSTDQDKNGSEDPVKNGLSGLAGEFLFIAVTHQPGVIFAAAEENEISLNESWMIGDILNDIEAGNRAGCHTILIDNGNETEWKGGPYRTPTRIASNLKEAAEFILHSVSVI